MPRCLDADGRRMQSGCPEGGRCELEDFNGSELAELVDIYKNKCLPWHPGNTTLETKFEELFKYAKIQRWYGKDVMDSHQRRLRSIPCAKFMAEL
ncbi:MAG: hypothetical protein Q8S17_14010, partial [Humidesulfovibrio sp.]|nr:hypothetical protein [Humidesulfovibrio sp.]